MDRDRIEAFLDRFVDLAAGATTIGLLAVAERSGLTSHLAGTGGGTVAEIAEGSGLQRRYVEEILSGLAAAGVLEYTPVTGRFTLHPEHALFLADETSPYFMGGFLDIIPAMMRHLDQVAHAVREGGGVPFEAFGSEMSRGIDRANSPSQRAFLISRWLPGVPGLAERLVRGISVADVGCGAGSAAVLIAESHPDCRVTGFDASPAAIETAMERGRGLANLTFICLDVADMPTEPRFDLVTAFDVIHDLPDPVAGLRRIRESLSDEGLFLMMEPNAGSRLEDNLTPRGALIYGISTLHCLTQSVAVGGMGLGAAWGRERAAALATEAGFGSIEHLEHISNRFSSFYLLRP